MKKVFKHNVMHDGQPFKKGEACPADLADKINPHLLVDGEAPVAKVEAPVEAPVAKGAKK